MHRAFASVQASWRNTVLINRVSACRCPFLGFQHSHTKAQAASLTQQQQMTEEIKQDPQQPPKAHVRIPDDGDNLTISLVVGGKQRNMNRPKVEPLQKALARLRANVQPAPPKDKKNRKKRPQEAVDATASISVDEPSIPIALYTDMNATQAVPDTTLNMDAWRTAALLVVGQESFQVTVNEPFVQKVAPPKRPMAGFPQLATSQLEFAEPSLCHWSWHREVTQGSNEWQPVGQADVYTPQQSDIGCRLKIICTPAASRGNTNGNGSGQGYGNGSGISDVIFGEPAEAVSDPVEPTPGRYSAAVRCQQTTTTTTAPSFRILSYNLLADQYAGSEYAQNVLFNYCPPTALDPDYRCQLILAELLAYNADIMCLQEVDAKLFNEFLVPHLAKHGFSGHYTNKQGKVREGSATFWRTSRFARLLSMDIKLRDVFKQPLAPSHAQWQPMLDASPELTHALQRVTTVAQASILIPVDVQGTSSNQGQPLCVVNTHLFYHPYAPHIRTMHTAAIQEEVQALLTQLQQQQQQQQQQPSSQQQSEQDHSSQRGDSHMEIVDGNQGSGTVLEASQLSSPAGQPALARVAQCLARHKSPPTVLFCGDLNSDLNDGIPGVVELLQQGRLTSDHWDWRMGANFKWGMNEEDGDAEQQAGAPQPPGSAIAAAVAAAKAAGSTQRDHEDGRNEASTSGGSEISLIGIDVTAPFKMRSADDLKTPFTNYTSGYKALLDYVWYQPEHLQVERCVPVPDEELLGSFIPSPSFPSDHLAVVYDLKPVNK